MSLRAVLVVLIALATAGFIVGTTIERNSEDDHADAAAEIQAEGTHSEEGEAAEEPGEAGEEHSEEGESAAEDTHDESDEEFKPFGIDIEAAPFVALAAIVSLALAAAAWTRPGWTLLLGVIAVAMLAFAALDMREVFHQSDEDETGLAVLAAVIALLHLAAAAVAGLMARESGSPGPGASMAG